MRITAVFGLAEDAVTANYSSFISGVSASIAYTGIGYNSTTVISGSVGGMGSQAAGSTPSGSMPSSYISPAPLGQNYLQALEVTNGNTVTFNTISNAWVTFQTLSASWRG